VTGRAPTGKQTYTVGVIGLGFGRAHIPAFQASGCEVVAVCQRDHATAAAVAKRYGVPHVYDRWERMLAEAHPDIVVIATPPVLHRAIAVEVLAAGAHVLCEKPLAMDTAEADEMAEVATRARRVAMTNFNWREIAAMKIFHEMVEAGHLGRLFHVSMRWLGGRFADAALTSTWRMDSAVAGHGAMGDMGVHLVDLLRWNFGEVARLAAHAGIAHPTRTVADGDRAADTEDFCTIIAELASGAHATLEVSRAARGVAEHGIEAYGSAGALHYRLVRDGSRWYHGELRATNASGTLEPVKVHSELPRSAGSGDPLEVTGKTTIAPLVARMLAAIRNGESPSPSFEDGRRAQAVLDAILESRSRGGGWVEVGPAASDTTQQ
jgi:predicted dehydrogenase